MRGSTLILHSVDPETLEKMEDLSYLDFDNHPDDNHLENSGGGEKSYHSISSPEDENNRLQKQYAIRNLESLSSKRTPFNKIIAPGQEVEVRKMERHQKCDTATQNRNNNQILEQRRNVVNNNNALQTSVSFPILDQLLSVSSSPPVNKSNYCDHQRNSNSSNSEIHHPYHNKQTNKTYHHRHVVDDSRNDARRRLSNEADEGQRRKVSTSSSSSSSQKGDEIKENVKTLGSGLPLSRVVKMGLSRSSSAAGGLNNNNEICTITAADQLPTVVRHQSNNNNSNSRGFSRFLFGLDFRGNNHKEDKTRLDVYNLSPQLKAELKRIYVY